VNHVSSRSQVNFSLLRMRVAMSSSDERRHMVVYINTPTAVGTAAFGMLSEVYRSAHVALLIVVE